MSPQEAFVLVTLLLVKHYVVDYVAQSNEMARGKGDRVPLLLLHSLEHVVVTFVILLFFTTFWTALSIILVEFIIHSIMDYVKANKSLLGRYSYPSHTYFILMGLDQLLHQLTYVGITAYLVFR